MKLSVVILAAGKGTRMRSVLPKVLSPLAGKPLLGHVIETAQALNADDIHVIYGYGGDAVKAAFSEKSVNWVEQKEQLGTGHAVKQALPFIADDHEVLVLYGDVPLIRPDDLSPLIAKDRSEALSILTAVLDDPSGYGRIIRNEVGLVQKIVEQKDANAAELAVHEVNTGFLSAGATDLKRWLDSLSNDNSQGEYYLTDIIAMAVAEAKPVQGVVSDNQFAIAGVNDRLQLAQLERVYQRQNADSLMRQGVLMCDPDRFDQRGEVEVGTDVSLDVNVILVGKVRIGNNVRIGANVIVKDTDIHDDVEILPNSLLEDAVVGAGSRVGPYARLRPEAHLAANTHIGNFVEIKKSEIGVGSKVNHLTYVGDSTIGSGVNIGAGTITCNYDGANKHRTVIGDNAFIGSSSQLVAPVEIGSGATIGAGSTISKDAPADKLTLSRPKQLTIEAWKRPVKKKP